MVETANAIIPAEQPANILSIPPMAQLARKMANVMGNLERLKQGGQNTQGWTFTSIDDITDAIRALMSQNGLALFSRMVKASEVKVGTGNATRATVDMEFEIVCADTGASKLMTWTASADDHSDKAMNKAAVYAIKFWLKSTFLVSTGKDPDAESPGLDKPKRTGEQPRQARQYPKEQRPSEQSKPAVNGHTPEAQNKPAPQTQPEAIAWLNENNRSYLVNRAKKEGILEANDVWADFLSLGEMKEEDCAKLKSVTDLYNHVKERAAAIQKQAQSDTPDTPEAEQVEDDTPSTADVPPAGYVIVSEAIAMNGNVEFNDPNIGKLSVNRHRLMTMLEAGDTNEKINGKRQVEAMGIHTWNPGSTGDMTTHTFPPIRLFFKKVNAGIGGVKLTVQDATPDTEWLNKVPEAPAAPLSLGDEMASLLPAQ